MHFTGSPPELAWGIGRARKLTSSAYALSAVVIVGLLLRCMGLGVHSLWFDETMTVFVATSPDLVDTLANDRHPPLYFLLLRWCFGLGLDVSDARWVSAALGCASLLCFALLCVKLLARLPAILIVSLFAVSPFSLWYAAEVRGYVGVELGTTAALLSLVAINGKIYRIGAIAAGMALATGCHYMGALSAVVVLGFAWGLRERARSALAGVSLGLAAWVPWLVSMLPSQMSNGWGSTERIAARDVLELPARLVFTHTAGLPQWAHGCAVLGGIALSGLVALEASRWLLGRPTTRVFRCSAWSLALGVGLALSFALLVAPHFAPRYLIALEPVLLLAIGGTLSGRYRSAVMCWILAAAVICVAYQRSLNLKEDYRFAFEKIEEQWAPGDRIVSITGTFEGFGSAPARFYLDHRPALWKSVVEEQELARLQDARRIWAVFRAAEYSQAGLKQLEGMRGEPALVWEARHRIQLRLYE